MDLQVQTSFPLGGKASVVKNFELCPEIIFAALEITDA
jgi:hypothetical protein